MSLKFSLENFPRGSVHLHLENLVPMLTGLIRKEVDTELEDLGSHYFCLCLHLVPSHLSFVEYSLCCCNCQIAITILLGFLFLLPLRLLTLQDLPINLQGHHRVILFLELCC